MQLDEIKINDSLKYTRHEYHHQPEEVKGSLLAFIYDVPYFSACSVFPPLHIINQIFSSGGNGDGGMGPGASWEAFNICQRTYSELTELVWQTDPKTLKGQSRYIGYKFIEDKSFDSILKQFEWMKSVCNKHRKKYRQEILKKLDE